MRTTVDLDPYLLRRLRAEAQRRGVAFKELLTTVISRGLEATQSGSAKRYRCPTFAMGTPRSPFDLDKALGLASALEDEETARKLALRK